MSELGGRIADQARSCTIAQAQAILEHHLELLWDRPEQAAVIPPLMLWGPPGVGKSAMLRDLCVARGIGFVDVRLAQREPVDIRGLPVPRDDGVHWLVSAEWPREGRGIVLFDELTAADRTLQVAAYELILDRCLGDLYRVPEGWYIAAAGNRLLDQAVALNMSSALANRFCHLEVSADAETWIRWALARKLHPDVVGFVRFAPQRLFDMSGDVERGWPSPRSWERVALELAAAEERGLDEVALRLIVQGLVGVGAATELFAYRSWAAQLPDVLALLRAEAIDAAALPTRADQRFALCAAAVHHADTDDALCPGLLRLTLALPSDFAAMCLVDYLEAAADVEARARRVFAEELFKRAWVERHGAVFRQRFAIASEG